MMEFTGKIKEMYREMDGRYVLSLHIEQEPRGIDNLVDKRLRISIGEYKQKRSLNANSYFHVLCDRLRQMYGMSMAQMKNHLIADYGQIMYLEDGEPLIYKTNAPPEFVYNLEEPHMLLVKTSIERDRNVYFYRVYRGSHTYDTAEMARLIDGTIEECKEQGIETMTPAQIERMVKAWQPT